MNPFESAWIILKRYMDCPTCGYSAPFPGEDWEGNIEDGYQCTQCAEESLEKIY